MEQLRIIKEMRSEDERNGRTDDNIRPRYMVWENVPGAFSSNKGEDFRIVLEEIAKICDKDAVIPMPDKGKWTSCGCIMGDGWSIAWRVLDAQFWGVPQRRRRIALVADFGGQSASEILFVRKGVSGHTESSKPKRKESASDASRGFGADDCFSFEPGIASREGGHIYDNVSGTLRANAGDNQMATAYTMQDREGCAGGGKSGVHIREDKAPTLTATHDGAPAVCYWDGSQVTGTLTANNAGGNQRMPDKENFNCVIQGIGGEPTVRYVTSSDGDIAGTLDASYYKGTGTRMGRERTYIAYCIGNGQAHDARRPDKELCKTLNCVADPMKICIVGRKYIVRRLTPLECERLQGYPDGWTDIGEWTDSNGKTRQTSDAARYKALGNSIALPPWKWVLKRLCACYERDATMASLFSGIGGFDLLWTQLNGKDSVLWESEIEDFPSAVCKRHFGDEATGEKGDFYEAILGRNKTKDV